jgi:uncharacterized membrane protein (UPF0127 family)
LGRSHWRPFASLIFLVIIFFAWGGVVKAPAAVVTIHNHSFTVEYADSPDEQVKGLSGRASLAPDHGMLFRFNAADTHCFWMKDMRFALDIIWINSDKKVVHLESNVSPQTYPKSYCPAEPARYVLEVNAGTTKALNLRTGDSLDF